MRNAFAETLYNEAINNPDIYVVVADISPVGSMQRFAKEYPDRFINVGVSEQAMISVCAGLALKGKQPFAYSIATFVLYRPFEFIRNDLCYQNLPVTVVGMGAGVTYADHGGTHHAMEDIAIASAVPNMQIIAPCDPFETVEATKWCCQQKNGPVYLRLGKSGEPTFANPKQMWAFGHIRGVDFLDTKYQDTPQNCCILTYGPITKLATKVAEKLSAWVASVSTLKPINVLEIEGLLRAHKHVIVIEEHVPNGGLSSQVKQIAWGIKAECRLDCFTLQDKFIHCNGTRSDMLAAHGLSLDAILKRLST